MPLRRSFLPAAVLLVLPSTMPAQTWNTPQVRAVVDRAIMRRSTVQADSGLRTFRARAHGFVFFLGQMGEGFPEPPRLIKSDQLALEVYWQSPGRSKQIIIGRRDRRDLPTDIQYHRDHLGIAQNNFGDQIRFGDGDEVRDVPHPLSPGGPALYDYALVDSLSLELPDRLIRVYQISVRPKEFANPRIVGTLFIDVTSAELIRFRFSFTPAAYLDGTLEDITVVLDNGLWFGRYWLPRRQEVEIRRRTSWLDIPARGIIRGRWEIGSYEFNVGLPPGLFAPGEPEIVNAPKAVRDTFAWDEPLDLAIGTALGPVERADLDKVRSELSRAAANRVLSGLPGTRLSFGSISDLIHVNRVEGLAPGFGWVERPAHGRYELRGWVSRGFSDGRWKARLSASAELGAATLEMFGAREVRDIGDEPVISRAENSFLSQERGYDFGDYVLLDQLMVRLRTSLAGATVRLSGGWERARSLAVEAAPAAGQYRPNPALGGPGRGIVRLDVERHLPGWDGSFSSEAGLTNDHERYGRARLGVARTWQRGGSALRLGGWTGWGSEGLPGYRSFVMGGRGSLPGEPFRGWGGRYAALGRMDVLFPVPFVAVPLGAFGSSGNKATGGLFLASGWTDGIMPGVPWGGTAGARPVAGGELDLFHGLLHAELGVGLHDGQLSLSIDVRRDIWAIL